MKRFVGLLFILVLFNWQTFKAYEITINATNDVENLNTSYHIDVWELNTYNYQQYTGSVTSLTTISVPAGDYVLYGWSSVYEGLNGHFYHGDYDELTILSMSDENPAQTIEVNIVEGLSAQHFKTYEIMNINGNEVIPIFQDFIYSIFMKQLVYENENNDIMLIGYQKYTPNGWETTLAEQEYLYLDNDAEPGDTFTSHNYLFWEGGNGEVFFSPSEMNVIGNHQIDFDGNVHITTAVNMAFTSMMDIGVDYWYEYTGNNAPLVRNLSINHLSTSTIYDYDYNGEYNSERLLNLQPETETIYLRFKDIDLAPKNLMLINDVLYWYGSANIYHDSYCNGYRLYWETNIYSETLVDSVDVSNPQKSLNDMDLLDGRISFYVKALMSDGSLTDPSNVVTISTVGNNDYDTPSLDILHNNYPNPFNPQTTIAFNLDKADLVTLDIFNLKGQKVKSLVNGYKDAGVHKIIWDGINDNNQEVTSGIYYYQIKSGDYSATKKMILLK